MMMMTAFHSISIFEKSSLLQHHDDIQHLENESRNIIVLGP